MAGSPYAKVNRLRRGHIRASTPFYQQLGALAAPVITAALLVPLVRPAWLWFLDELPPDQWAAPLGGAVFRLSLLLLGWVSLDVYGAVVRGRDRPVLEIYPVDPALVVRAEIGLLMVERWWVPLVAAAVLAPLAVNGMILGYAMALLALSGTWVLGISASAMVYLMAAEAAQSKRWEPVLDLVRGTNPRSQAAFIWAPGVVLAACALLIQVSTVGVVRAVADGPIWAVAVAVPLLVAPVVAIPIPALARRRWFQVSTVLEEIRARYETLQDPQEALRVYLEWTIRFLPARVALFALKDLRQGWRGRRTWISATWLVGLGAFGAGWTEYAHGPGRAAALSAAGVWATGAIGVRMHLDDPAFLSRWFEAVGPERLIARVWAIVMWTQCCVGPAMIAVAVRRGWTDALFVGAIGEGTAVVAGLATLLVVRFERRPMAVYGLVGVLASALTAAVLVGGGVG